MPFLLQLLQLVVPLLVLLPALVQVLVIVIQLGVVSVQCLRVHLVRILESTRQLKLFSLVGSSLLFEFLLKFIDLFLEHISPFQVLLSVTFLHCIALNFQFILFGLSISLLVYLLILQILKILLSLFTLLLC
jgi:hypothetical protein